MRRIKKYRRICAAVIYKAPTKGCAQRRCSSSFQAELRARPAADLLFGLATNLWPNFFAGERTALAWNSTALTFMAFGFAIERFGLFIQMPAEKTSVAYHSRDSHSSRKE